MFFALLFVTFILAAIVSYGVIKAFEKPIAAIFNRIIKDDISASWEKYVKFAAFVVGVSGGVRIHQLERYISAPAYPEADRILTLNAERWTLEVYRTIIETLQSLAWMYLVVFLFSLIAYVIVKGFELRSAKAAKKT